VLLAASLGFVDHIPLAFGQELVVAQSVEQTHTIELAAITELPPVELQASFQTGHGLEQATYTGALVWSVLNPGGTLGEPRARLHHIITVTGRDGYSAVLALAEIDPEFEGKQVILAYRRNGQPLPSNELRLVVPNDHRGGRSVREVVRIELR
jgi:hypothetical protein